jgi:1,2-diacylglycerol 3-beta-galactosyltransferase
MGRTMSEAPHILFLFSDTGGGHRSATEAIIEAIQLQYGTQISTEMVDIIKQYGPPILNRLPDLYPQMVRVPQAWGLGYRLSNGHKRARLITASAWPYLRRSIRTFIEQHPSDLIVSVHPLAAAPVLRALGRERSPFITVVTDLVTTHALWYHRRTDLCIVPTEEAYRRGVQHGMKPEQIKIIGLPVAERFCHPASNRQELRIKNGWPLDRKMILLVGGGDGMGPLEKTAQAIASARLPVALAVVTGRNRSLKKRLESHNWPLPMFVYGFVKEMPDFMRAADILVTKAGPGTISEALIAGLPMVLYSRLPGQEDGNVTFVVSEGAGVWAPQPEEIVSALKTWINNPEQYEQAAMACQRLARPHAAREIAALLAEWVGVLAEA